MSPLLRPPAGILLATLAVLAALALPPDLSGQEVPAAAQRIYVSNNLGMPLEEIHPSRREEFDYILVVAREGEVQRRTLFHDGQPVRRWELDPGEEREYEGGELVQLRRYDEQGRPTEEQSFEKGELSRRTVYHYGRERLERLDTYGPDGTLLHSDHYRLSAEGELRRVTREQGDAGDGQQLSLSGGEGICEERYGNARERRFNRYDTNGRLAEQEYWYGGTLIERQRFQYRGDGEILSSSLLEEPKLERTTRRIYDEQGLPVRIEVEQKGQPVELTVHVRDGQGRILETTRRGSRGIERWLFQYDEEGEALREEYRVRGALESITEYRGQEGQRSRVEELYRDGRPFMRVHYRGEQKVKEEFLREGEVVRVREFQ